MPIDRFSVTFTVAAPPDDVFAHLADPQSHVGLSPLVVRLDSTVDLAADGTGTRVTETIEVRSPGPLRRFVTGKARSVQSARRSELTRRMGPI